jgi:hypothetical protein
MSSKSGPFGFLKDFIVKKISKYCTEYLKKFDSYNINKVGMSYDSLIHLELLNLELREDLLAKVGVPFWIEDGCIGKISIKIPRNPVGSNTEVTVDNVFLRLVSIREKRIFKEVLKDKALDGHGGKSLEEWKATKFKEWETKTKLLFSENIQAGWVKKQI